MPKFLQTDLPKPLLRLIESDTKVRRADFSITELIQPPRITQLWRRHSDNVVIDPRKRLWACFSKVLHRILSEHEGSTEFAEEVLVAKLSVGDTEVKISGEPDLFDADSLLLIDYKLTSVWAVLEGIREDWEKQLNCYRWLYKNSGGFEVKGLQIVAMLRDWSQAEQNRIANYPAADIVTFNVPMWSLDKTEAFIRERVKMHDHAQYALDSGLTPCTDNERWASPLIYKVVKPGATRAVNGGVFSAKDYDDRPDAAKAEAEAKAKEVGGGATVVVAPQKYTRCERYCDVAPFCNVWQDYLKQNPTEKE